MVGVVAIADIEQAAVRLRGEAVRTPLVTNPALDASVGAEVFIKPEILQRTGSFKFRGAYNTLASLSAAQRANGVLAVSSGNHAQGVAAAARIFGVPATIIMPDDAPRAKLEGTRRLGARIVTYRRADEDREAIAAALLAETGAHFIHPYEEPLVIAGQGTIGLEIAEDLAARALSVDAVLVPCGGGGLSSGVALALSDRLPGVALHVVEPQGFDDYGRSLRAGEILPNAATTGSICDALLAHHAGATGFAINAGRVAGALSVSDDEVLAAVAFAFRTLKLVVEPGGAVALAALLSGRFKAAGQRIVIVLSGGNIDPPVLASALAAF